ncbi:MAG TPA: type I restriction endonuclease [Azospirillaceae bacterium]|nr:type I restriction endonuclease [Azospirillaceae bacterium]
MSADFKQKLVEFAKRCVDLSQRCANEESAKLFLILPFLGLLGYDDRNPHEVCPEHGADFSDKYKNRVDFAILKVDEPIIAIECKAVGTALKDERGQLRSYFNAAKTVKMGILTDGIVWEFYADTDEPNMMDASAFLTVDLRDVAKGKVEDSAVEGLRGLQKACFDPANIGAEAKRKLVFNAILKQIAAFSQDPPESFVRLLLTGAGITHARQKVIEEFRPLVMSAFKESIDRQIIARLDLPQKDADRAAPEATTPDPSPAPSAPPVEDKIVTTETELVVFNWAKQRLAFLVRDESMFAEIANMGYRDYQGKFVVFYKKERKGRMFDFIEGGAAKYRFVFAPDGVEVVTDNLMDVDKLLQAIFLKRIAEDRKEAPAREAVGA